MLTHTSGLQPGSVGQPRLSRAFHTLRARRHISAGQPVQLWRGSSATGQKELGDADCVVQRGRACSDRAKALNKETWAEGRPILEAHAEINTLLNESVYTPEMKKRLIELLIQLGLKKEDQPRGGYALLRQNRGRLLRRSKVGAGAGGLPVTRARAPTRGCDARTCDRPVRSTAPDIRLTRPREPAIHAVSDATPDWPCRCIDASAGCTRGTHPPRGDHDGGAWSEAHASEKRVAISDPARPPPRRGRCTRPLPPRCSSRWNLVAGLAIQRGCDCASGGPSTSIALVSAARRLNASTPRSLRGRSP